jgi:hypothetical protein
MGERGWLPSLLRRPKAVHRMMSMLHVDTAAQYLVDLRAVVDAVRAQPDVRATVEARYS